MSKKPTIKICGGGRKTRRGKTRTKKVKLRKSKRYPRKSRNTTRPPVDLQSAHVVEIGETKSSDRNIIEPNYTLDLLERASYLSSLDEAPQELHDYINFLEENLETPITIVSVGPDRKQTFFRKI